MNDRVERSLSGRIDDVCDAFEQEWKSNQRPSIVKYLKGFEDQQRLQLLRELLLVDVENRHRRGEDVNQADYETEIPEITSIFSGVIDEIANQDTRLEDSKSDTRDSAATIEISSGLVSERSAGRYEILKHHAGGGLGDVFVARDSELNREVALKEIKEKYAHDEHSRSRFVVEAEITGRLEHPGIVPVYGMGKYDDGRPYYAMRFIKGDTLQDAIRSYHKEKKNTDDATLELRKLLNQFVDVCNAVEYAHSRGVIHRDLKPANVMLGKFGETLVVDWGLAKQVGKKSKTTMPIPEATLRVTRTSDSTAETQHGDVIGTAQYMSPEQAAGHLDELAPASDVYSLGAVLFCILTEKPPFEEAKSTGLEALLKAVRKGRFQKPREIDASVPKALEAICLKAMQTEPEDRYESAKLLADDVERYLADEPVEVHREPLLSRTARWGRKHKAIVSSVAVLLVTSVIALSANNILMAKANSATELAHEKTKKEQKQTLEALDRVEDELYVSRIISADWKVGITNEIKSSNALLEACPEEKRNWEWHYLWNKNHGELKTLKGHSNGVTSVAFSPDGQRIVTGSRDKTAKIWDASTGQDLMTLSGYLKEVTCVSYSPNGQKIVVVGQGTTKIWDATTGRELMSFQPGRRLRSMVLSVAFSPDGRQIAFGGMGSWISTLDATTGKELKTGPAHIKSFVW